MYSKTLLIILLIFVFFKYNSAFDCSPCTCETNNAVIIVFCSFQTTQINKNEKINEIPSNIRNFNHKHEEIISELDFEGQNFNEINDDLSIFESAEKLKFSNNMINTIHPDCIKKLTNLKTLYLDKNQINVIPPELFKNNQKIEHIFLNNNQIKSLQSGLFANLPNLTEVHLNQNNIERIEDNCFVNVSSLATLDLSSNNLITLSSHFIDNFNSLTVAYFDKNPWVCDGDLCDLINISLRKKWLRGVIPDCYHPNLNSTTKGNNIKTGRNWNDIQILKPLEISQFQTPVYVNQSVALICEIHTCSLPSMLWLFRGVPLENPTHCIEGNKHTLTNILNEVTKDNEGSYTCLINNCSFCGNISRYLTVESVETTTTTDRLNTSNGNFQLDLGNSSFNPSVDLKIPDFTCTICLIIGIAIGFVIGFFVAIFLVIMFPIICCGCCTTCKWFNWFIKKLALVVRKYSPSNNEEIPLNQR